MSVRLLRSAVDLLLRIRRVTRLWSAVARMLLRRHSVALCDMHLRLRRVALRLLLRRVALRRLLRRISLRWRCARRRCTHRRRRRCDSAMAQSVEHLARLLLLRSERQLAHEHVLRVVGVAHREREHLPRLKLRASEPKSASHTAATSTQNTDAGVHRAASVGSMRSLSSSEFALLSSSTAHCRFMPAILLVYNGEGVTPSTPRIFNEHNN